MHDKMESGYAKLRLITTRYRHQLIYGSLFWVGVILIAFGINRGIQLATASTDDVTRYSQVETQPTQGLLTMDELFGKKQPFTLVLHRTGCPACKHAEKHLMRDYTDTQELSNAPRLVMNVANMSPAQIRHLIALLPQITINGKIPTPLVANVIPLNDHKAKLAGLSQDDTSSAYHAVFKRSERLEAIR